MSQLYHDYNYMSTKIHASTTFFAAVCCGVKIIGSRNGGFCPAGKTRRGEKKANCKKHSLLII